jgi:hypothetical protein
MKILGICLWHEWEYKSYYFDCSNICIWSSGTEYYRQCKCCKLTQKRRYYQENYSNTTDKFIINKFKKEK